MSETALLRWVNEKTNNFLAWDGSVSKAGMLKKDLENKLNYTSSGTPAIEGSSNMVQQCERISSKDMNEATFLKHLSQSIP
jgi:hypothetical protein